jgi:hypothetical protein
MAVSARVLVVLVTLALAGAGWAGTASAQTPLTACGVLAAPGNYLLTKNLTSAGTCFVIAANGVGLDLGNHTIRGNGTGSAITDGGTGWRAIVIARGLILNFQVGIDLGKSTNVTIEKLRVQRNVGSGIVIGPSSLPGAGSNTVTSTVASANGDQGIFVGDCCNTFNEVKVIDNGGHGLQVQSCCSTIIGTSAHRNGGHGLFLEECCHTVVETSTAKNTGNGISLGAC